MQCIDERLLIASNMRGAGLGNRIRFTLSALSLAEATSRKFFYLWPKDETFCPMLNQLWEFNEPMISEQEALDLYKLSPGVKQYLDLVEPRDSQPIWHFHSHETVSLPHHLKGLTWGEQLRGLKPENSISERIEGFFKEYLLGKPFIGVMIRSHKKTNPKTLSASPVEWYISRMADLCSLYPGINFFVSSDTEESQNQIMEAFPTCYGQLNKGSYGSDSGVASSVVDLYLLASSSYMLVPYFSSFPVMAHELCGRRISCEHSNSVKKDDNILSVPQAFNPLHPELRDWQSTSLA